MRLLCLAACLLLISVSVSAQELIIRPGVAVDAHAAMTTPASLPFAGQSSFPRPVHHCCHLKGFLIGAGIGAGLGAWWSLSWCTEGICATDMAKSMLILGGIGGGLGAFLDQRQQLAPPPSIPFAPHRRLTVSGVLTGRVRAIATGVTF